MELGQAHPNPECFDIIPAHVNNLCDSFQLVMINQSKMTVFIFWKMNLTGAFATKLALGVLSAVPRLAFGAGKWVTSPLGLFAGTAGT